MRKLALLAVLFLSACQTTRDQAGNKYPEACLGDLSHIEVKVEFLPQDQMPPGPAGRIVFERVFVARKPPLVIVSDELSKGDKEDAIRHAKCHIIAGAWHS